MATTPDAFGTEVLRACGIDPADVRSFTLSATAGEMPILITTHHVPNGSLIARRWRVTEEFATGGIVLKDQIAIVGEHGPETVIPWPNVIIPHTEGET